MQRLAWHAANLMNVHLKKKVTVKKLLGKEKDVTKAEKEKKFAELTQKLSK
ncbi:hypothetical protein SAMN05444972_10758 [Marininema halotolerans]|uniref:Uncharacterized protein n=2 Tax=Marininema halotolerans TaxID=1155944 RepID=A0A1I6SG32_9BACL|nr:hypothetical protein SAMN05444972_10758 [Marininema halotolerans]